MTLTVSISDLRNNISQYLERVTKGTLILIRDEKRGKTIAQISQAHSFNKDDYEKAMNKASGILSEKNHPEWATQSKIANWLTKSRLSDERSI